MGNVNALLYWQTDRWYIYLFYMNGEYTYNDTSSGSGTGPTTAPGDPTTLS